MGRKGIFAIAFPLSRMNNFAIRTCRTFKFRFLHVEVFKNILQDYALGKRGKDKGPILFITDEINALKKISFSASFKTRKMIVNGVVISCII